MFSRRSPILMYVLIISGALNLALLGVFMLVVMRERKELSIPANYRNEIAKPITFSHEDLVPHYVSMPFEQLVRELYDETHVEQGLRRCDLALSCLVNLYGFDLERALPAVMLERREWTFQPKGAHEGVVVTLYPGISEDHLRAVQQFARTEVWPLTPRGLYQQVKMREAIPTSLQAALMLTPQLCHLKRLFAALSYTVSEETLLDLIHVCDWETLDNKGSLPDFLYSCIEQESQLAAYLLVQLEREYAVRKLDNDQLEKLLGLLTDKTPEVESFLVEVSQSMRPHALRVLAQRPLNDTLRTYIVKCGDSLWKISHELDVKVDMLRALNKLESDHLKPGTELILPSEEKSLDSVANH